MSIQNTDQNQAVYESQSVADRYSSLSELDAAESEILARLESSLGTMSMLDLGVGGGRTTEHFAPRVAQYLGVDYSQFMVDACKERFKHRGWRFEVADARAMTNLQTESQDFVLFSYNGIDYASIDDRKLVFAEVRRVLRKGGSFAFSTHNLNALRDRAHFRELRTLNPRHFIAGLRWKMRFWYHNRKASITANTRQVCVNDGALGFSLLTCYTMPSEQVGELSRAGFTNVQVFLVSSGKEVPQIELETIKEDWFYLLCRKGS